MSADRYERGDLSFAPPAQWTDRTVVVFQAPPGRSGRPAPNMVMVREGRREGERLRTFAQRRLNALARHNPGLEIRDSEECEVGGRCAIRVRLVDTSEPGPTEQT